MGGPSAALVLADLAELGVRRAVRVGTCVGMARGLALDDLLVSPGDRRWRQRRRLGVGPARRSSRTPS